MPTLVLLRHAKSDYPDGVGDHERPLADRGRREAPLAGSWLAERVRTFDLALVSTARRAQQTWQAVSASVAADEVRDDDELYLASSADLLTIVRQLPGGAQSVLVVGHNEGLEELATLLSGVPVTLKTSTFAVLRGEAPWANWEPGSAHLTEVVVAR
jgi:phosphohistidine phosphatase